MEKQEIVKLCLKTYRKGLKEIKLKDSRERVIRKLQKTNIHSGICYFLACNEINFKKHLSWINKRDNFKNDDLDYWTDPPLWCKTKKEIVESLKYRINILKSHLK